MLAESITGETVGWQHPLPERLHKPVFGVFLLWLAAALVAMLLRLAWPESLPWLDGLVWPLAAATALVGLARRLPLQNVVAVGALAGGLGLAALWLGTVTDIPFGRRVFSTRLGDLIGDRVPWSLPFLWLTLTVTCRGIARLILRPWRGLTDYGLWVMGVATALALVFDLVLEPIAYARGWWRWDARPGTPAWHSAPWVNFLGWTLTSLTIYGFSTPWLLNKRPVKQPTDWHPLLLWVALLALLATGGALDGAWDAVALGAAAGILTAGLAIRGGNR